MTQPIANSKEWWEARYQGRDWYYGKEPSKFLIENLDSLRKGKVLDLGMGEGRNAVYLASKGFRVEGVDFSETAGSRATKLAKESGVEVGVQNKDIDMFLMPLMAYDTLLIIDYKPSARFFNDLNRGLVQNGIIVIDAYTVDQMKHYASTNSGPNLEIFECYKPNEVLRSLKNVHVAFYQEREVEPGRFRVQCLARKTTLVG